MADEIERVVEVLEASERVCKQDLRNMLTGLNDAEIGTVIWRACERLRKDRGIDFGAIAGLPGYLARRSPLQIGRYAIKQRAKGTRAHVRALQRLQLAASLTSDEAERRRLEQAARVKSGRCTAWSARLRPARRVLARQGKGALRRNEEQG